jgi:hypothetical protein
VVGCITNSVTQGYEGSLHSVHQLLVTASLPILVTLMMEALSCSETKMAFFRSYYSLLQLVTLMPSTERDAVLIH